MSTSIVGYTWSGDPVGLAFAEEGRVRLSGCNEHGGEVQWADSQMVFSFIESTETCTPELEQLDLWLRDLLLSRPTVTVDAASLTVTANVRGVDAVLTFVDQRMTDGGPSGFAGTPALVTEGSNVVVELHSADVSGGLSALGSRFHLTIERREGVPFLVIDQTEAVVPEGVSLWVDEIDGRRRSTTTARQGSTGGIRLTDGQATNGVRVVIRAVDEIGHPVAVTAPVFVSGG